MGGFGVTCNDIKEDATFCTTGWVETQHELHVSSAQFEAPFGKIKKATPCFVVWLGAFLLTRQVLRVSYGDIVIPRLGYLLSLHNDIHAKLLADVDCKEGAPCRL